MAGRGAAKPAVRQRVEQGVAGDDQRGHEAGTESRVSEPRRQRADGRAQREGDRERVGGAAVSPGIFVTDAQAKADEVRVGQERERRPEEHGGERRAAANGALRASSDGLGHVGAEDQGSSTGDQVC
jgi:hypothetical protein